MASRRKPYVCSKAWQSLATACCKRSTYGTRFVNYCTLHRPHWANQAHFGTIDRYRGPIATADPSLIIPCSSCKIAAELKITVKIQFTNKKTLTYERAGCNYNKKKLRRNKHRAVSDHIEKQYSGLLKTFEQVRSILRLNIRCATLVKHVCPIIDSSLILTYCIGDSIKWTEKKRDPN